MDKRIALSLKLELLWWLITSLITFVIIYPILNRIGDYPFLIINIIFILVFVTFTRYAFLLKHTFLAHREVLKIIFIILSLPLIFYLFSELYYFQIYLDEKGITTLIGNSITTYDEKLLKFIRSEMLLFGVGSIIIAIVFPFRMILSIWRVRNRGTV